LYKSKLPNCTKMVIYIVLMVKINKKIIK